ncbi:ATP-binding protein [Scytonema sp. UIC 10036]|uniref:ATP-binding protein n=1 Tax=Scytonema sp. UIC 10036 TaxID=2304196 RepID=UPI001FAB2917|nr:ATP-binding protein [Scytonema sp. UIC 10036]
MRALMRAFDWASTPVGPIETWSQSLKSNVKTLLASRYPMVLIWGSHLIQFYNDAYSKLIGDKHPSALGTDIRITLAEAWDTLGPMIDEVMATGVANWVSAQMLVLERSGYREESYFSLSHAPAEDDTEQIVGMFCVCSEVTQQVLGERRLRLLRDLASKAGETRSVETTCRDVAAAIAEHPLDIPFAAIYLCEGDGKTLTRYGEVQLPEEGILFPSSVYLTVSEDNNTQALKKAAAGETVPIEGIDSYSFIPGGPWNEPTRTALVMPIASSSQAAPLGVLVAGVSPNRALDEGYSSFYELLAAQVSIAVRNAQAYEEERRRAEMLAELDRAKTTFFSNVSHEFRTPLTLMLGPLEDVLQDPQLSTSQRERITVAQRNSLRLLKLVNTLLDFSRIEAGRIQAVYERTDLATLTANLASVFRSAIEKAGLLFVVDCPPLPEDIYVDRDMWEKIVLNLLSNAFKFTQHGQIAVRQYARAQNIELCIEDTGIGIPESELLNVFKRFHRIEGTQGRTYEGTGIGLALVQELVKLHGGSVRVHSLYGSGSTFTVSIPLGKQHLPADRIGSDRNITPTTIQYDAFVEEALRWLPDEEKGDKEALGHNLTITSPPARILLADDNADMREYVRKLLSTKYEVVAVADGEAALAAAQEQLPDLVLSDVMMPKLDGFGLLRRLREDERTRSVPIVLLSARAGEESRIEGLDAGADNYLIKPFSARELLARVKATLEMSRLRQEVARSRIEVEAAKERAIVIERVTDAFYGLDRQWRFTYVNRQCEKYLKKTREELLGKVVWDVFPVAKGTAFEEQYYKAMREQVAVHFEVFSPFSDLWVEVHVYPSKDGISVNFRDITERKELEKRQEALLESERVARAEAERIGRLKDEFLATLSHELRTPLNAILGWSQLLRKNNIGSADLKKGLETIERNARSQAQIIEDLLDMSRIISGKVRLDIQEMNLTSVIQSAIESLLPTVQAKEIRLQTLFDVLPHPMAGDPNRLQQVVWNLLSNAIKFTPKGGRVRVSLEQVNSHVELTISDTGQGIKPEFLPYVFDRFRQADGSTTRQFGGLGLGLSIVKQLVELHGGTVQAASPGEGQGAQFTVVLPLPQRKSDVDVCIERYQSTSLDDTDLQSFTTIANQQTHLNSTRVLVVDDEVDAQELVKRILEECGADVLTASSADEALEFVQTHKPHVVLSDISMPGKDGYELIRQLRGLPSEMGGDIPAAAVTAFARFEDRIRALRLGYQTHIAKPIEAAELIAVVVSLAGRCDRA